ncbi:MAG TPA: hypothetical protein VFK43_21720, partial [Acidimicrobiales bacterium]|nr:hypothetical protein [Acidimicrobiales bacterium]
MSVALLRPPALAVAGAAGLVVGSVSPWATFPGFPGKMSLGGFPGGARLFCLLLAAGALLFAVDVAGRRKAALFAAAGAGAVVVVNIVALADQGGGIGSVAWGAWLALAGAGALVAAAWRLPAGAAPAEQWRRLAPALEVGAIAVALLAVLGAVVWGLEIEESSRFISVLVFLIFVSVAIHQLGVFTALSAMFTRHHRMAMLL